MNPLRSPRPWLAALAAALMLAMTSAQAAPLSPTQTTALLLGLLVNGDLTQGQQLNDAIRAAAGSGADAAGAEPIDLEALATLRAQNPRLLAERLTESMPAAKRAALAEPLRRVFAAVADTIRRSRCSVGSATRQPDPDADGQWIATVNYTCVVADMAPVMERLRTVLPRQQITSERAADAAAAMRFDKLADMLPGAPIELPVTGTLRLTGSDLTVWRAPDAGAMLDVVSRPILDAIGVPTALSGQ